MRCMRGMSMRGARGVYEGVYAGMKVCGRGTHIPHTPLIHRPRTPLIHTSYTPHTPRTPLIHPIHPSYHLIHVHAYTHIKQHFIHSYRQTIFLDDMPAAIPVLSSWRKTFFPTFFSSCREKLEIRPAPPLVIAQTATGGLVVVVVVVVVF